FQCWWSQNITAARVLAGRWSTQSWGTIAKSRGCFGPQPSVLLRFTRRLVLSSRKSQWSVQVPRHLPPNHAFNRTRPYGVSTWRTPVAAGRLTHALRLSVKYFLQSPRLKSVAANRGV